MTTPAHLVYRHVSRRAARRSWAGSENGAWLGEAEREVYAELRDARRREGWLFGRLLAKQLILDHAGAPPVRDGAVHPVEIQIHSRDGLGRATRPRVTLQGRLQHWSLSIAHSDRSVLVAFSEDPGVAVGADVTPVQRPSDGFLSTWLTPWERGWLREQADQEQRRASILWAVKEAFFKSLNLGGRFAPQRIEVRADGFNGFHVRFDGLEPPGVRTVRVAETGDEVAAIVTAAWMRTEGT